MSGSVTVPGGGGSSISDTFSNTSNQALAQQIANALAAANTGGAGAPLNITTASVPGAVPAPTTPGTNELIITGGGGYTVQGATSPISDYIVILENGSAPVTINGSPNISIWGGGSGALTIIDPALTTIADSVGSTFASLTGAGAVLASNDHNDTLVAAGSAQSIASGAGTNLLYSTGTNDTISAKGVNDTIIGGSGASTFLIGSTANNELAFGEVGAVNIVDAGTNDTLVGSFGQTNVTLSGSKSILLGQIGDLNATISGISDTITGGTNTSVTLAGSNTLVFGEKGSFSVVDTGLADTIVAGSGPASVTALGGANLHGETGTLDFLGGAGDSTVFGGSGDVTVTAGSGGTTLFGGASGLMTYLNSTTGSLLYHAGSGAETLDASLSRVGGEMFGGSDTTAGNLLVGGAGNDTLVAGTGADTLMGGGGSNLFVFFSANGGAAAKGVIGDFSAIDTVLLSGYGTAAAAAAIAGATTSGNSTTITLSDNTKITFTGVTSSAALQGHIVST